MSDSTLSLQSNRGPVLIGMRGSGKSSVGCALAKACGLAFLDSDAEIEQRLGQPIPRIFTAHGEAYFRQQEEAVLLALLERPGAVLATGGGAVLHPTVRARLAEQAAKGREVVWLRAEPATLVERIAASQRPSLTGKPLAVELPALLAEREPLYAACATVTIDTTPTSNVQAIVAELQTRLAQR